jgi:triosephosphate isomerase
MRRPLIIGVQKLFLNLSDSIQYSGKLSAFLESRSLPFDVLICPSLINLAHVATALRQSQVYVGAQNFHQEESGPFTGQVSLHELIYLNIRHVLIGHSELCQQGETDALIRFKVELCLKHHITPIICLGEEIDEQKSCNHYEQLEQRIKNLFSDTVMKKYSVDDVIIAYEPTQTPLLRDENRLRLNIQIMNDSCIAIREILNNLFDPSTGENIRILFGGGVNESSAKMLLREMRVDGFLVGRASTNIASFLTLLEMVEEFIHPAKAPTPIIRK